jgi:hypothetical protein
MIITTQKGKRKRKRWVYMRHISWKKEIGEQTFLLFLGVLIKSKAMST